MMMSNPSPKILALDFDGVICDGILEYFQTSKRTYQQIWSKDRSIDLDALEPKFAQLRPVIETGWEMPLLLRAIVLNIADETIFNHWPTLVQELLVSENLDKKAVGQQVDTLRDRWIESDLNSWLELHRFYRGVIDKLAQILVSEIQTYIITTKERRFVRQLLSQQGIEFPEQNLIGKDSKRPKYETLRQLLDNNSQIPSHLWFVEDRLPALQLVEQQPDLQGVGLYLATWGYNTQQTRNLIQSHPHIHLLSLQQFTQDFSTWKSLQ